MYAIEQVAYLAANKFDQLVKRFQRRVPSVMDAEDIIQTAFEKAVLHADKCREGEFDQWFATICENCWKDWVEQDRKGGITTVVNEKNGGSAKLDAENKELYALILGEIANLPSGFKRNVLYRRICMGLPVPDISYAMEVDKERVTKCIYRWRKYIMNKYSVSL